MMNWTKYLRILAVAAIAGILPRTGDCQDVIISEFMAFNRSGERDDDGDRSDWIELHNRSTSTVNLRGWKLTDSETLQTPWVFPAVFMAPQSRMVVYASGKNRIDPDQPLHTSFQLTSQGEYLSLKRPDNSTASEFSPQYPPQYPDIAFGRLEVAGNRSVLLDFGVPARAFIPQDGSLGLDWIETDFNDAGWLSGTTGIGYDYGNLIGLNTADMRGNNESVYVRIPFTLAAVPEISRLILNLQYEDGMIAYLNGIEIASDNAPSPPQWNSGAPQNRPDSIAVAEVEFDITGAKNLLRTGKNVLSFHALNNLVNSSDLLLRPQLLTEGESESGGFGYIFNPTPRDLNGEAVNSPGPSILFSSPGGTFTTSTEVLLSLETSNEVEIPPNTVIRYTTDLSMPDQNSTLYGGPVQLTSSTTIRARSFGPNGMIGPVSSYEFIRLDAAAGDFSSNLPIVTIDTDRAGNIPSSGWLPVRISIFEPENRTGRTRLTGPPEIQTAAGIRVRGSSTAGRPKPSLSLELWDEYNRDTNLSLLDMPAESDWILWGPYNFDPTYLRNPLIFELSRRIGSYATRTRFVEVFLNRDDDTLESSDYFGVYVLTEKISRDDDRVDVEKLFPEYQTEPWITGGYIFKIDRADPGDSGFFAPGQNVLYVDPKETEMESAAMQPHRAWVQDFFQEFVNSTTDRSRPDPSYTRYLDVDAAIDHHLLNVMAFNVDALRLSTYMHLPRNGKLTFGPVWDFDRSQGSTDGRDSNANVWRSQSGDRGTDFFNYPWWSNLFRDPEFFQRYIDRWQAFNAPGQPLHINEISKLIDEMANEVREASARNESRWGVFRSTFNSEITRLKSWYQQRLTFINSQFVDRPEISYETAGNSIRVTITSPEGGQIYFTTDNSDPRRIGGSPSGNATRYNGPFLLDTTSVITARVLNQSHTAVTGANNPPLFSQWSGPVSTRVSIHRQPSPGDIVISEIHYHPAPPSPEESAAAPGSSDNDFEFLEITNESTDTLDLGNLRVSGGIDFDFSQSPVGSFPPGGRLILIARADAFAARYGNETLLDVAGVFSRSLSNAGENILLQLTDGTVIFSATYVDSWYPVSDGPGFSIELRPSLLTDRFEAISAADWRAGSSFHGSPGTAGPPPAEFPRVIINEILAHSDPPLVDFVEIYNLSSSAVDLSHWSLTDNLSTPLKFRFPAGSILDSGSWLVIDESQFNASPDDLNAFSLSATGDDIYLISANADGSLTGYVHGVNFGDSRSGESFGRFTISTGQDFYPPLVSRSPGSGNAPPRIGPVIISEIMFNPPAAADGNSNVNEYIELTNISQTPVNLFHTDLPANTWRIAGGTDFTLPADITLAPRESIIITGFSPTLEPDLENAFRNALSVASSVRIFGPLTGNLNNAGDRVTLRAPGDPQALDSPNAGVIPYYLVDEVSYQPSPPWPDDANGNGNSLIRHNLQGYGNDPVNWVAATPSPGKLPAPPFSISAITLENSQLIIRFDASPGFRYTLIQSSSILPGSWEPVDAIDGPSGSTTQTREFIRDVSSIQNLSSLFFSIRVAPR